ncbi:restriction endonuclease subunit S [Nostoc sp. FACHB-152]|uniref:restriction endonuclease subunit S n=1 Tax=unclassified Nostoc TaxID=2593658 RepID=UPI0016873845|nr:MULTISPECIES: restriction endonuclease subunit S [unclassified Nostoc]MBD2448293.1 restriction endonuclease subunit S [Nostoc sp. FACHB-152]MBD2467455.1 restriction endonuclease subunit S [Nostoc sp. FACHB-145]
MLKITLHPQVNKKFILYFLKSPIFKEQLDKIVKFTAQPAFNVTAFKKLFLPFPPLEEQKRIVEKCDRLMSLCDTLEAKLKQGRDSSEKLMEVAAKQVLTA